ncbi:hypothetical protein [Micromonospora cathayae]|uniref:Uncharacterized protein n=1 Tax=Micromonospora cathayae TaxID=3028804 RepID=A0ABY7ZW72_9ACTN|nr:hypothetical protein [Micromonospora sp. HUAS 3]WDZ87165.1 hypothetical protein PVK37_12555 [Micromonospora sp. HUAS 3]
MNSYRADIYAGNRLVTVRHFQAADLSRASATALSTVRAGGHTHADIYEGGPGHATHVDTVINNGGGR